MMGYDEEINRMIAARIAGGSAMTVKVAIDDNGFTPLRQHLEDAGLDSDDVDDEF